MTNTLNVGVGGVWKPSKPYVGVGGVWKPVQTAWVGVGGVWKQFYAAMGATISPTTAVWSGGPPSVSNQSIVATPVGGTSPYTYAWEATDDAVADFPTNQITNFSTDSGNTQQVRCKITDHVGNSAYTPYCTISF